MQDGAPCHQSKVATDFLKNKISLLEWPENSPDLNPIDNLWTIMKDKNFGHILGNRAVAYVNVDTSVQGNYTFAGRALPMLFRALYDSAKQVPNPNPDEITKGRKTVYDTWAIRTPQKDANGKPTGKPRIPLLGSGSDFAHFISKVGVTCADLRYRFDEKRLSSYPLYHSVYDTFHLVDKIMDPTFAYHKATTQVCGELALLLADSYILPFDVQSFATAIEDYANRIDVHHGSLMIGPWTGRRVRISSTGCRQIPLVRGTISEAR
ncbi:Glutamate carboxypeptidase 2 [Lamellibrachia satsuma]|nr:Glutamate carboxypeptidase 2 [Lamellibrachia satsuma]